MKYDKTRPGLRQIQSGSCCGQFRQTDAQIIISFETFLWASASSGTFFSDHRQGYKKTACFSGNRNHGGAYGNRTRDLLRDREAC